MKLKSKEKEVQKAIIDFLEWRRYLVIKFNNVGIFKKDGSYIPPRQKGVSDIIACKDGKFIAIEVKSEKGKPTQEQLEFLDDVKLHGGISFIAKSIDDVISNLSL